MTCKDKIQAKLDEIACCEGWCILKEIVKCQHSDIRFFTQLKCIEKYKFEESERQGADIGWQQAHIDWVDKGYAEAFAHIYEEDLTANEIYTEIVPKEE